MTLLTRTVQIKVVGQNDTFCDDHCPMRDRSECRADGRKLRLHNDSERYTRSSTCLMDARVSVKEEA
jgi:hypothetical protein